MPGSRSISTRTRGTCTTRSIVIDGEIVIAGSFNFSESADRSNDENLLIIYNRAVAAAFEEEFQRVYKAAREADGR